MIAESEFDQTNYDATDLSDSDDYDTLVFSVDRHGMVTLKAKSHDHHTSNYACSHKREGKPGKVNIS